MLCLVRPLLCFLAQDAQNAGAHGSACISNDFIIRTCQRRGQRRTLKAESPAFPDIGGAGDGGDSCVGRRHQLLADILSMEPRLSLIARGVADLDHATAIYRAFGCVAAHPRYDMVSDASWFLRASSSTVRSASPATSCASNA